MKDASLSELFRQASIKTDIQLIILYNYSWQDFLDTGRSTEAYILFYQVGPVNHGTYVLGKVAQWSAESEYNIVCTSGIDLAHFRMIFHEFLRKYPDIVQEEDPLNILAISLDVFISKNG